MREYIFSEDQIKETLSELKKPREYSFNGNEKEFQNLFIEYLDELIMKLDLPKVKEFKLQHKLRGIGCHGFPDVTVLHEDNTLSIFELKRTRPIHSRMEQVSAIGQALFYQLLAESEVGGNIRTFLVDYRIEPETYLVCIANKLRITLIEINGNRVLVPYRYY